jgi:hypothetical protein
MTKFEYREIEFFAWDVWFDVDFVSVQVRRHKALPEPTTVTLTRLENFMSTFTTQPSTTVRAVALVASLAMSCLCLGGVAIGLTWDVPDQTVVAQHTALVPA